jgi:hypothetical protein
MAEDEKRTQELLDRILDEAKRREPMRNALGLLFPKAESTLKTYLHTESDDLWERRKSRRISTSDYAPQYFRMDPQPATWSRAEIEKILNQAQPRESFALVEDRLQAATEGDRARLRRLFLQELRAAFRSGKPMNQEWLEAIVDASPGYIIVADKTEAFLISEDNQDRLRRAVLDGLVRLAPTDRAEVFKRAIQHASDLSLLCDVFRSIEGDVHPSGARNDRVREASFGDAAEPLRSLLTAKISRLSVDDRIWDQAQPGSVLWFWWGCDLEGTVQDFTRSEMEKPEGIRQLLRLPVQVAYSSSEGRFEHVPSYWSRIVDLQRLAKIAEQWSSDPQTPEEDRVLARRYLEAFQREDTFGRGPREPGSN